MEEKPKRILIVEDDRDYSNVISGVLREQGYSVQQAFTLDFAEELLVEKDLEYDIILWDRHLPDGTSMELIRRVKQARPNIPMIAMSADANGRKQQLEAGCTHEIPPSQVINLAHKLLSE